MLTLYKIKHYSSCMLGFPFHSKPLAVINSVCSIVAVIAFVIFRFYFFERYKLYGCRRNYKTGFPRRCDSAPSGLDMDCVLCLLTGLLCSLAGRFLTFLSLHPHWECRVSRATKDNLLKHLGVEKYSENLYALLCKLQGVDANCHCNTKSRFTTVSYMTCIPVELYLSAKLKKWGKFVLLLLLFVIAICLPFALLAKDPRVELLLSLLLFLCFPVVAIGILLVSIPFLHASHDLFLYCVLGSWLAVFLACMTLGWISDHYDERVFKVKVFKEKLLKKYKLPAAHAETCLVLLSDSELTSKDKARVNDLLQKLS